MPVNVPADPAHKHFATTVVAPLLSALLALGNDKGTDGSHAPNDARLLRPNPIKLMPHGLASVKEGFEYMMSGKVRWFFIPFRIRFFSSALSPILLLHPHMR